MDVFSTFLAQFVMVFCLGFQSLNVNRGHYFLAAGTSLVLGVAGFHLTATIARVSIEGAGSSVYAAYIIAGPIAIVFSMWFHQKFL